MEDYQKGNSLEELISDDGSKLEEFQRVCKPVVDYLREKHTPHTQIIIDQASAELFTGELGTSYDFPANDSGVLSDVQQAKIERLIEKKLDERAKNFVEKLNQFKPSAEEIFRALMD